jgi:hypothetical protein
MPSRGRVFHPGITSDSPPPAPAESGSRWDFPRSIPAARGTKLGPLPAFRGRGFSRFANIVNKSRGTAKTSAYREIPRFSSLDGEKNANAIAEINLSSHKWQLAESKSIDTVNCIFRSASKIPASLRPPGGKEAGKLAIPRRSPPPPEVDKATTTVGASRPLPSATLDRIVPTGCIPPVGGLAPARWTGSAGVVGPPGPLGSPRRGVGRLRWQRHVTGWAASGHRPPAAVDGGLSTE